VGKEHDSQPFVLLVGAMADSERTATIVAQLAARALAVRECASVYVALARLGRDQPVGVVVRVDGLDPSEFEFFHWAGRLSPGLPILVYSELGRVDKIELALRRGATALVDDQSVAGFRAMRSPKPASTTPARAAPDIESLSPPPTPRLCTSVCEPLGGEDARDRAADSADGEADTGSVRVPWIADLTRPQRTPPAARARAVGPGAGDVAPNGQPLRQPTLAPRSKLAETAAPAAPDLRLQTSAAPATEGLSRADLSRTGRFMEDDPPLLTPEELAALIGDEPARPGTHLSQREGRST